ncbi:MAG: vWA domain-containing protein [Desulfatirhabdiaceae bacterium]
MAIDRFHIAGDDGYSEYWRRDKSPLEQDELAKVLRSIRKVCSYVGRNIGDIVWAGMNIKNGISLDPAFLMGKYPLPAFKTDIIIGMAVHKSYQIIEWSDHFRAIALRDITLLPVYEYKFNLFFDMAEKIYSDLLSNRKLLGLYTEKHREWELREKKKQFINPPTVDEVLHIWWKMAADRTVEKYKEAFVDTSAEDLIERISIEKFYKKPLVLLNSIIGPLKDECPDLLTVSERGAFRLSLYKSIWNELLDYIRFWPNNWADPFMLYDKFDDEIAKEEEEKKAIRSTVISFAKEIERKLKKGGVDYTDDIKSIVTNVDDVVRIEENDIVMPAENKVDKKILNNLRMVIKSIAHRNTFFNRGLVSGKIDRRRLYRAVTTCRVFLEKKNRFDLTNNFVVLVDCTGSMSDPTKWNIAQTIYQTLFSAIKEFNSSARFVGYNEVNDTCRITDLYRRGRFYSVSPNGKTASGEAIIATVLSIKKYNKQPFIVHITDGASNWGCGVCEAISYCQKKQINLLTLGIGCNRSNKNALKKEYGKKVEYLENIQTLPRLLKSLL